MCMLNFSFLKFIFLLVLIQRRWLVVSLWDEERNGAQHHLNTSTLSTSILDIRARNKPSRRIYNHGGHNAQQAPKQDEQVDVKLGCQHKVHN